MLNWVNTHGIEAMGLYVLFLLIAGTVPPLPPGAGFLATWAYFLVKAISVNARGIGNALGMKAPELQLANLPGMKAKIELPPDIPTAPQP